jgi:hypothetical protein
MATRYSRQFFRDNSAKPCINLTNTLNKITCKHPDRRPILFNMATLTGTAINEEKGCVVYNKKPENINITDSTLTTPAGVRVSVCV